MDTLAFQLLSYDTVGRFANRKFTASSNKDYRDGFRFLSLTCAPFTLLVPRIGGKFSFNRLAIHFASEHRFANQLNRLTD